MMEVEQHKGTFSDRDYLKMSESGFQATGWKEYKDSPYYQYERLTGQTARNRNVQNEVQI